VRLLLPLLLAATLAIPVSSTAVEPDRDPVAYTNTAIWLRATPSLRARTVAFLPQGTQVRILRCAEHACRVAFRRLNGYVAEEVLGKAPAPESMDLGRGYINSRGQWIPSPTWTSDGLPPQGATAQCSDGSFSFSQSAQGTCSWHGGVALWL
jgi:uncharacterized protein DUF3761